MRVLVGMARALPAVWVAAPLGWPARLVLAALLTAIAWPAIGDGGIVTEVMIGLLLGLVASVPFRAAQAAGATLGIAQRIHGPDVLGDAFGLFALALFAAIGGPLAVARAWGESYAILPAGSALPGGIAVVTEAGARLIGTAIALSLPALGALLLAELMAALLVKAQPVLVGGGPLRLLVTLVAIIAGMSAIITVLASGGLGAVGAALEDAARRAQRP